MEELQLLLNEQTRDAGGQIFGYAFGGRMGTVSRSERIVDVQIRDRCKFFRKLRVVLFLFRVEANIFQQQHIAISHCADFFRHIVSDAVIGLHDGFAEEFTEALGDRVETKFLIYALRTTEVASQNHLCALGRKALNRGQGSPNAGIIGDRTFFVHRNVKVTPHKYALALQIGSRQIFDRLLSHSSNLPKK